MSDDWMNRRSYGVKTFLRPQEEAIVHRLARVNNSNVSATIREMVLEFLNDPEFIRELEEVEREQALDKKLKVLGVRE